MSQFANVQVHRTYIFRWRGKAYKPNVWSLNKTIWNEQEKTGGWICVRNIQYMFRIVLTRNQSDKQQKNDIHMLLLWKNVDFESNRSLSVCIFLLHDVLCSVWSMYLSRHCWMSFVCVSFVLSSRATSEETSLIYWVSLLSQNIQLQFPSRSDFSRFQLSCESSCCNTSTK